MRQLSSALIFVGLALLTVPAFGQTVPENTDITIRLNQEISSQNAKPNQRVKASVAKDVVVSGDVLIPKGAPAAIFVSKVRAGDGSSKPAVLTLRLDAITVGGRAYPVSAGYVGEKSVPVKAPNNQGVAGSVGSPVKSQATSRRSAAAGGAAAGNANPDIITSEGIAEVSYPEDAVLSFRLSSPLRVK